MWGGGGGLTFGTMMPMMKLMMTKMKIEQGTELIKLSFSPPRLLPSSTVSPPLMLLPAGLLFPNMYRMNMHCTPSWWIKNLQSLLMGPRPDP